MFIVFGLLAPKTTATAKKAKMSKKNTVSRSTSTARSTAITQRSAADDDDDDADDDNNNNNNNNNNNDEDDELVGDEVNNNNNNKKTTADASSVIFEKNAEGLFTRWRCTLCLQAGVLSGGAKSNGSRHLNPYSEYYCPKLEPRQLDEKQTQLQFSTTGVLTASTPTQRAASSDVYRQLLLNMFVQCSVPFNVLSQPSFIEFAVSPLFCVFVLLLLLFFA